MSQKMSLPQVVGVCALAVISVFPVLLVMYILGSMLAFAVNVIVNTFRHAPTLGAWQGMACLVIGAVVYHFIRRR